MLEVGKIVNTHGLRGEVKVVPWTDYPEVFEEISSVFISRRDETKEYKIKSVKYQKNNIILKLSGIDTIDEAEKLRGVILTTERSQLGELPEGTYYIADLIGLAVYDEAGELLGRISDVLQTGSNDVYVVKRDAGRDLLIPVIDGVVLSVDIDGGKVSVHLMEGLTDL